MKKRNQRKRNIIVLEQRNYDCPYYAKCLLFAARKNNETLGCNACREIDDRIVNTVFAVKPD